MAPQAVPTINGTAGSNPPNGTAIVVGSTVQLNNTNGGGEVSYLWELLDIPEGSASALSDPAIQNPTFVADSEGTYLVKLTVNRTLSNEASTKVIVGVSQLKTLMRIPAAGESTEMSTLRGWAMSMNRNLRLVDNLRSDPGYMTGYAAGTEAAGHVLYISGLQTLKSGLPGEEKVPIFTSAVATSATSTDLPLWVFVSKAGGGTSVSSGDLLYARLSGVAGPFTLSGGSAGDAVYLSDTGQVSDTPGTYVRRLGTIVLVDGSSYYVHFNGSLGHHEGTLYLTGDPSAGVGVISGRDAGAGRDLRIEGDNLTLRAEVGALSLYAGGSTEGWVIQTTGVLQAIDGPYRIAGVATPTDTTDAANKAYVDAAVPAGAKSILCFGNSDTPAAATECALDPGFGVRTSPAVAGSYPQITIPLNGKVSNLYVHARTGPVGAALDFTVYKVVSGSPSVSSVTCQLAISGTDASDLTHNLTVAAGDQLEVRIKGAGSVSAGAVDVTATLQFTPT